METPQQQSPVHEQEEPKRQQSTVQSEVSKTSHGVKPKSLKSKQSLNSLANPLVVDEEEGKESEITEIKTSKKKTKGKKVHFSDSDDSNSNSSSDADSRLDSDASFDNEVVGALIQRMNKMQKKMSKVVTSDNINKYLSHFKSIM